MNLGPIVLLFFAGLPVSSTFNPIWALGSNVLVPSITTRPVLP